MSFNKYLASTSSVLLALTISAVAQSQTNILSLRRLTTSGFFIGYGKCINPSTEYQIAYFAADISSSFTRIPRNRVFNSWYLEPQINPVRTLRPLDIELGINAGIRTYVKLSEKFFLYGMIGSGPHYISAEIDRQAKGFIFSDNFAFGGYMKLLKSSKQFINLQLRYRHISNAGLKKPNKGINSWNLMIGISPFRDTGVNK